jgi:hypothetical protein
MFQSRELRHHKRFVMGGPFGRPIEPSDNRMSDLNYLISTDAFP